MMSTLILGCGYLGLRLARQLRESRPGADVFGTTRSNGRFSALLEAGAEPVIADLSNPESLAALPGTSEIVLCAALKGASGPMDGPARIACLEALFAELRRREWRGRFVHVSTTSVYGQNDGSWVDERSPTSPTTESGRIALALEHIVASAGLEAGFPAIIVRLSGLYGPGRIVGRQAVEAGLPISGNPSGWLNLIRAEDAARAIVSAVVKDVVDTLYIASDNHPILRRDYYEALARRLLARSPQFRPSVVDNEPSRRVSNRLMKEGLGITPQFSGPLDGLADLLP